MLPTTMLVEGVEYQGSAVQGLRIENVQDDNPAIIEKPPTSADSTPSASSSADSSQSPDDFSNQGYQTLAGAPEEDGRYNRNSRSAQMTL